MSTDNEIPKHFNSIQIKWVHEESVNETTQLCNTTSVRDNTQVTGARHVTGVTHTTSIRTIKHHRNYTVSHVLAVAFFVTGITDVTDNNEATVISTCITSYKCYRWC